MGRGWRGWVETIGDEVREKIGVQIIQGIRTLAPKGPNIRALSRDIT